MIRFIALAALLIAAPAMAQTGTSHAIGPEPARPSVAATLACSAGAVAKTYGATAWTVHGCSDGHSIAIVANPGSKAAPCTFTMAYQGDGSYQAHGRCGGDKTTTQNAFNDIGGLNAAQVQDLYNQTQPAMPAATAH
jgi:hypothetical protein